MLEFVRPDLAWIPLLIKLMFSSKMRFTKFFMTLRFNPIHLFFLFASDTKKGLKENSRHVTKNSISRIGITRIKKKGMTKHLGIND